MPAKRNSVGPTATTPRSLAPSASIALAPLDLVDENSLTHNSSFIARHASPSMSFADLIRARESQQKKLRGELEAQNQALRDRLGLISNTLSTSPSGAVFGGGGNGSDWGSPPQHNDDPYHQLKSREFTNDGDGTPTLGPVMSASFSNVATSQQLMDVINFVADMKDSVRRAQESDTVLLQALRQRVEEQERRYEERLSVLEARLAGEERAHEILREEQSEQIETLTSAIDELKTNSEAALHERCTVIENGLSNHQLSLQTFAASTEGSEERLQSLEASLATLQRNQTRDEIHLHTLSESVERDRSLMSALKDETIHQRKEQLDQIFKSASTQLEYCEKQMSRLQEATHAAQEDMERIVGERISQVEETLRDHVFDLMGTSRDTLEAQIEGSIRRMNILGEQVTAEAQATRGRADDELRELKDLYRAEVNTTLEEVVQRAKQLENDRRAEFPVADVDRVNLMIHELEGAAALLEGFAKNTVLLAQNDQTAGGRACLLTPRVDALEHIIEVLQEKVDEQSMSSAKRAMFSVDVQTGPLSRDNGPSWSDEDKIRRSVDRHLKSELELAAADHSAMKARTETALTILAAASSSSSTSLQRPHQTRHDDDVLLSHISPPRSVTPGSWSRGASPRVGGVSVGAPLPLPSSGVTHIAGDGPHYDAVQMHPPSSSHARLLAEVVSERQKKEATVDKIQQILREIQTKFHELSVREPLQRSLHTNIIEGGGGRRSKHNCGARRWACRLV
ncbi:Hypothetical protein, putative [Bodo saltans]|uniref:Uncharacterized protein n=1 Tax=Bodo saltans TaxID=75058 RepID=A0A0S4J4A8_BODSA|nr:Hypothetical protein, putative [Bodo saltans]|eukprot:CUG86305.1 Hypothetical protein, putative [Bodo saltans]